MFHGPFTSQDVSPARPRDVRQTLTLRSKVRDLPASQCADIVIGNFKALTA